MNSIEPSNVVERYRRASGKPGESPDDSRSGAQRDRDRLLYSWAFRRLAEITQVAPPDRTYLLHNRLTHSLKVAQIGRRLAEKFVSKTENISERRYIEHWGGLNPDTVECVCLAHDLGHPPFGHITEKLLDELVVGKDGKDSRNYPSDGYEGNAQTFRIVSDLELASDGDHGMDLTLATLNGILKYPWLRKAYGKESKKFGAYRQTEKKAFDAAREIVPHLNEKKTLEADIMDQADAIAYAVYDVEDYYCGGLIPLDRIFLEASALGDKAIERGAEIPFLLEDIVNRRLRDEKVNEDSPQAKEIRAKSSEELRAFCELMEIQARWDERAKSLRLRYAGTDDQRAGLRRFTARLIDRYSSDLAVNSDTSGVPLRFATDAKRVELEILQQLIWTYVIDAGALPGIQFGQKKIVKFLFEVFTNAARRSDLRLLPEYIRDRAYRQIARKEGHATQETRVAADIIWSLTENQAVDIYARLMGIKSDSVFRRLN